MKNTTNDPYVLVVFEDNWADEMDLEGFKVMRKSEWENTVKEFREEKEDSDYGITFCFGTNEDNEYDSVDEALDRFTVTEISDCDAEAVKNLFPTAKSPGFGMFPIG